MGVSPEAIKASVLAYWRYTRQCPLVALEASCRLGPFKDGGSADVLVVDKQRYLIEVEVKTSIADLRRDMNKLKHRCFRGRWGRFGEEFPTYLFYFAVPKELANMTVLVCDELYPYAGVIGSDGMGEYGVEVYREPTALWGKKLTFPQILRMAREQSATVCRLARRLADMDKPKVVKHYGE